MEQRRLIVPHSTCLATVYHNGKARVMVLDSVETEANHHRQGHATKLLKRALALARELQVDAVELVVNDDNEAAKSLYRSAGFRKTPKEHWRIIL